MVTKIDVLNKEDVDYECLYYLEYRSNGNFWVIKFAEKGWYEQPIEKEDVGKAVKIHSSLHTYRDSYFDVFRLRSETFNIYKQNKNKFYIDL